MDCNDSSDYIDRVGHIIFHETEDGKGLTIVPTVDGSILLGPTRRELPEDEEEDQSFRTKGEGIKNLEKLCEDIVPGFDLSSRIRTFGSLRPRPFYVALQEDEYVRSEQAPARFDFILFAPEAYALIIPYSLVKIVTKRSFSPTFSSLITKPCVVKRVCVSAKNFLLLTRVYIG
jgi:L-2-hydroxyglutarate oxidase LhgO